MLASSTERPESGTYTNPVYSRSFPDPFVVKFAGEYYAYSTGFADDGSVFNILHSSDLVDWTPVGGAMAPLENSPPFYWAPEAIYDNGHFYLYYSVGNETLMELRVAVSDRPDGGFVDSGRKLTHQDFAIDAHVFVDDDGTRWMFYATDFLEHTHIGTGTVVDRMLDWFTLEGDPQPVTRAKYDWQVYDPNRKEKGGVRWHTVEGPTVLKRKGLYYEMFSGGNWQNTTYGVSFALADKIRTGEEWRQLSDGVNVLPVLRTIPGVVDGPGHNSVVRGPNNRELYCVYHRWVNGERVMAIDRMDFAGDRLFVIGATNDEQPAPYTPTVNESGGSASTDFSWPVSESFLAEVTLACEGRFGIRLESNGEVVAELDFAPESGTVNFAGTSVSLPDEFDWKSDHVVTIECDHRRLIVEIDRRARRMSTILANPPDRLKIFGDDASISVRSIQMTNGFEERFEYDQRLEDNGWSVVGEGYKLAGGHLAFPETGMALSKGGSFESADVAANFRMTEAGEFSVALTDDGDHTVLLAVKQNEARIELPGEVRSVLLPANLALSQYHQLRVMKKRGDVLCYFDDLCLGEFSVADVASRMRVTGVGPGIAVEMIRLTRI